MGRLDKEIDENDIKRFVEGEITIKELAEKYGIQPLAMSKRIAKSVDRLESPDLRNALENKIKENQKRAKKSIHISDEDIKAYQRKEITIKELAVKYQCNRNTMSKIMSKIFPEAPKGVKQEASRPEKSKTRVSTEKSEHHKFDSGNKDYVGTDMFSWIPGTKYTISDDPKNDEDLKYKVCMMVILGKADVETGMEVLGIKDRETIKDLCLDYICQVEDKDLARQYLENIERVRNDYSKINFASVAVRMLKDNLSQSEIADRMFIPARVVSREFKKLEKLDDDNEPKKLYTIIKQYAEVKMRRQELSDMAMIKLDEFLDGYCERHPDFFKKQDVSKTEQVLEEKKKKFDQATVMLKAGKTRKEIAKELGISVSSLRRILFKDSKKAQILNGQMPESKKILSDPYADLEDYPKSGIEDDGDEPSL